MGTTIWTYKKCYEEAKKYKCRKDFQYGRRGAYRAALKYGWLNEYKWMKKPQPKNKKWNHESCFSEAKKYREEYNVTGNGTIVRFGTGRKYPKDVINAITAPSCDKTVQRFFPRHDALVPFMLRNTVCLDIKIVNIRVIFLKSV